MSAQETLGAGVHFVHVDRLKKDPSRAGPSKLGRYGWAEVAGKLGKFAMIPKRELTVDNSYQRPQSVRRARDIAAAFDWRAFGTLLVSRRKVKRKTINYVIDGGHRLLAGLLRPDVGRVPCLVFEGLTQDEEAEIFVAANTKQKKPSPSDIFLARVSANDPTAQGLLQIFRAHGLEVKPTGEWLDTGIKLLEGQNLKITAEGVVKISSTSFSPDGKAWVEKDTDSPQFSEGCHLVGKISAEGKEFAVGKAHTATAGQDGKLYLRIKLPETDEEATDSYKAKIKVYK